MPVIAKPLTEPEEKSPRLMESTNPDKKKKKKKKWEYMNYYQNIVQYTLTNISI